MRIGFFLLISGLIQPVMAITKCEINGVVSYKQGSCPVNASSKYLINKKYVSENQLRQKKREHQKISDEDFLKFKLSRQPDLVNNNSSNVEIQSTRPQSLEDSGKTASLVEHEVVGQERKAETETVPHVNVPGAFDYVNPKLEKMNKKLQAHNKKLQQLQNAE